MLLSPFFSFFLPKVRYSYVNTDRKLEYTDRNAVLRVLIGLNFNGREKLTLELHNMHTNRMISLLTMVRKSRIVKLC